MRFKNYINRHNKKNRIYAEEELLAMTLNDLFDNEESILAQDMDIGIPTYEELKNSQNTRWYDSFVNSQGQQDDGYYGSILPNYPESMFPQKKPVIFEENPYRNNPISMNAMEDFGEFNDEVSEDYGEEYEIIEENPVVLEGGVEENVYKELEEEIIEEMLKNQEQGIDQEQFQNDSTNIDEETLEAIKDDILNNADSSKDPSGPSTLPNNNNDNMPMLQKELQKLYEEWLKRFKKKSNNFLWHNANQGKITGGASKADFLQGVFNDYKSIQDPTNTTLYVLGEFLSNYLNMKYADTHGADKYFHAKANYEAAQQGIVGSAVAKIISDIRELTDSYRNIHKKHYTPEYSKKDLEEDQKANEEGRNLGRKYPTKPPYEILEHIKPNGLPKRYQKRW